MVYGPAKGLPLTISSSLMILSFGKTSSSTIGPELAARTPGNTWSLPALSVKTTVESSLASTDFRLPSRDAGPLGSAILTTRSMENFTSEDVSAWPLANLRPGLSLTVYSVGVVNDADSAMSGEESAVPGLEFMRNG